MDKNQRREGESIQQWKERIEAQQRAEIQPVPGGELEPSVVTAEYKPAEITQGYSLVNAKPNNYRVGRDSVFGERKYDPNPSFASRTFNWITDALHLTSPPTFQDGYGRTLNAEVPTWESAQGQELKRMGQTAMKDIMIASIPFLGKSLFYNPLGTTAGFGVGIGVDQGIKSGFDHLNESLREKHHLQLPQGWQNAVRLGAGLFTGKRAYNWGTNTTKRAIETAMHTTGDPNPIPLIARGIEVRNWGERFNVGKYILTGKNTGGTSNTLGMRFDPIRDEWTPSFYTGLNGPANVRIQDYDPNFDLVRSYLYGTELPALFTRVDPTDYGVHTNYILRNYPGKKINVYEMPNYHFPDVPEGPVTTTHVEGGRGGFHYGEMSYDAAGHMLEQGLANNIPVIRGQDMWKFNPKDYTHSWEILNRQSNSTPKDLASGLMKNLAIKYGLALTDYHGTPFIVRQRWGIRPVRTPNINLSKLSFKIGDPPKNIEP